MKISHTSSPLVLTWTLILLLNLLHELATERISDKIYTTLQSDHYCGRRMNATHQVGCQSDLGGNLGIVWMVSDDLDLSHILTTGPTPPYIAILKKTHYTKKILLEFKASPERVSGVVFLDADHDDSKSRSSHFSPDDVCPNRYSGLYVNDSDYGDCRHHWQEESPVSGLLYEDIPFPIFLINDKKSIEDIEKCFRENNVISSKNKRIQQNYPLCGIQLDSFMLAAKDSSFCLNSRFVIDEVLQSNQRRCYTVDNSNVFAYYKLAHGPVTSKIINNKEYFSPATADPQSIVMVVTKLSSLSMFAEISPGADSTVTSIVTLLAVAEALGKVRGLPEVVNSKRNILFALLDSEPFDYTGSAKVVYDMNENAFPTNFYARNVNESILNTNLSSIDYLINLDQLAIYPKSEATTYFHSDPREPSSSKLDSIFEVMRRTASSQNVKLEREAKLPLPPTSAHEFIRSSRLSSSSQLTGMVLSNYGSTYQNKLYNSIYDDSHNIYQTSKSKLVQHLTQVSQFLAQTLFEVAFQVDKSDKIKVSREVIEQLLECYLVDAQCPLFTRVCQAGQKLPKGPIQTYKDPTKRSDDINGIITSHLLAYYLGDQEPSYNQTRCYQENMNSTIYEYLYINNKEEPIEDGSSGMCIRSQLFVRSSGSPAYTLELDSGEIYVNSTFPAWTVSLNGIRNPVRLYLIPSPMSQWALFFLGVLVTVTSFVLVLALKTKLNCISIASEEQPATST